MLTAWLTRRDPAPSPRLTIALAEPGFAQGLSADGRSVVVAGNPPSAFDLATGQRVRPGPTRFLHGEVPNRDGRRVVGVATDPATARSTLFVADAATEAARFRVDLTARWSGAVGWSDDEASVWVAVTPGRGSTAIETWDFARAAATTRAVVPPTAPGRWGPVFGPGGRVVAFLDDFVGRVQFWDDVADRPLGVPVASAARGAPGRACFARALFDPKCRRLLIGRHDGRVEVWDVVARSCTGVLPLHPADHQVTPLHLSPDGRTLAATGLSVPATTGFAGLLEEVRARTIGRTDVGARQAVALVDLATLRPIARLDRCTGVAFTPDGRSIVTGKSYERVAVHDLADLTGGMR